MRFYIKLIIWLTIFSLSDKLILPERTISTILQVFQIVDKNDSNFSPVPVIKKGA